MIKCGMEKDMKDVYIKDKFFEGEYINGEKNGKGKEYNKEHKIIFEGEYLNGKRHGKGKEFYYYNQLKFEGEYLNNIKWTGKGYDEVGNVIYEIKEGKGYIKEYNFYGHLDIEGEYLNGKINGKGKQYSFHGITFEGEYLNNKIWNGKGEHYIKFLKYKTFWQLKYEINIYTEN